MPVLMPITRAFMWACAVVFLLQQFLPPSIEALFALWPLQSGFFMPWQVLSYAFMHGDFFHLFLNMLGLWSFGSDLERLFGQKRYIQLLVASTLTAAATQLIWTWLIGTPAPTVGASGALFGLLLAYGVKFPDRTMMLLIPPVPMKAKYFVMVFAAIELVMGLSRATGVAHFAHLGGMVGAWVLLSMWRGGGGLRRVR
jgi:membrane associated rhomboid family serine protease